MTSIPARQTRPLRQQSDRTPGLVVRQQPGNGLAAVAVGIGTGSDDDPADCHGMAHLVEHLHFERSEAAKADGHAAEVSALGGTTNAETHRDHTVFHSLCPANRLVEMVELEVRRLERSTALMGTRGHTGRLSPGAVSRETEVIADEIRGVEAISLLWDRSRAQLRPGARDGYGSVTHLRRTTPGTIARWFEAHYRPENIVLVIVGDATSRQVDEVTAILSRFASSPADVNRSPPVATLLSETGSAPLPVKESLVTGFHGVALAHPMPDPLSSRRCYLAHVLLTHLLARTVLPAMVRKTSAWRSATVSCGFYGEWLTSRSLDLVQATFAHAPGTPLATTQSLWKSALLEAADAAQDPVVLQRTINTLLLAYLRGGDSLVGQAITLARDSLLFEGYGDLNDLPTQLAQVSGGDLANAATTMLSSPIAITHLQPVLTPSGYSL